MEFASAWKPCLACRTATSGRADHRRRRPRFLSARCGQAGGRAGREDLRCGPGRLARRSPDPRTRQSRPAGLPQAPGQEIWSKVDEKLLREIALTTQGAYIPAGTRVYDLARSTPITCRNSPEANITPRNASSTANSSSCWPAWPRVARGRNAGSRLWPDCRPDGPRDDPGHARFGPGRGRRRRCDGESSRGNRPLSGVAITRRRPAHSKRPRRPGPTIRGSFSIVARPWPARATRTRRPNCSRRRLFRPT